MSDKREAGLQLFVFSDKVSPPSLGFLAGYGYMSLSSTSAALALAILSSQVLIDKLPTSIYMIPKLLLKTTVQ